MSFNQETKEKINKFAKEQSQYYLTSAEMTYMEKLRKKVGQSRQKINHKIARFKSSSQQAREAENDMVLYMSDYINDLMEKGMPESEAFEIAKQELSASGDSDIHEEIQNRISQEYEDFVLSDYEAIGLFYGGLTIIGMVIGAVWGFLLSGGRFEFLNGGWIDTLIGAIVGMLIGVGLALIFNAVSLLKKRK